MASKRLSNISVENSVLTDLNTDYLLLKFDADNIENIQLSNSINDLEKKFIIGFIDFIENQRPTNKSKFEAALRDYENYLRDENHLPAFVKEELDIDVLKSELESKLFGVDYWFNSEKNLVCTCLKKTFLDSLSILKSENKTSFDDLISSLQKKKSIGGICSICKTASKKRNRYFYLDELFALLQTNTNFELEKIGYSRVSRSSDTESFVGLSLSKKAKLIEDILGLRFLNFMEDFEITSLEALDINVNNSDVTLFLRPDGPGRDIVLSQRAIFQEILRKIFFDEFKELDFNVIYQ